LSTGGLALGESKRILSKSDLLWADVHTLLKRYPKDLLEHREWRR
jgi:hypothetical protein